VCVFGGNGSSRPNSDGKAEIATLGKALP